NAFGEELLMTCVYRDLHGSQFHREWVHSTRAHNAVLVNGQGQAPRSSAPLGRIAEFVTNPEWDYVSGDATRAYGNLLERYFRHIVFLKPDLIVIYDELVAREPSTFQFMLHAGVAFEIEEKENALRVDREKAGVDVRYLSPADLSFRQWDGFEPAPERRQFPNQWHVEAGTVEKAVAMDMLTVAVPYRAGSREEWTAVREESESAVGVRFTRNGEEVLVAFRRAADGAAELAGWEFTGPAAVRGSLGKATSE